MFNLSRTSLKILLLFGSRIVFVEHIDKIFFVPGHILSHSKCPVVGRNNLVIDHVITELLDEIVNISFGDTSVKCAIEDCDRHINILYRDVRWVNLAVYLLVCTVSVVILPEVATISDTLPIVDSGSIASTTWESRVHDIAS